MTHQLPPPGEAATAASASRRTRRNPASCPRCGYDLRALPAAWSDRCPLEGACSECGLAFRWRDILQRGRTWPGWIVEDAGGFRDWLWRCVRTAGMAFLPWRFWSRLHVEHPIRTAGLRNHAIAIVLLMYGLFVGTHGFIAHARYASAATWGQPTASGAEVVMQAVLLPLSGRSPGAVSWGGSAVALEAPAQLIVTAWGTIGWLLILAAGMTLLAPLGVLVLRPARRVARVRPWHIVRAAVYCLPWLLVAVVLACGAAAFGAMEMLAWRPWSERIENGLAAYVALLPGVLFLWWLMASSRYLRLRRPVVVALCAAAAGVVGGCVLLWLIDPAAFPQLGRRFGPWPM